MVMEYRIDFGGTEEGGSHSLPFKTGITSERTNSRKPKAKHFTMSNIARPKEFLLKQFMQ
jgi:hypothetical protein